MTPLDSVIVGGSQIDALNYLYIDWLECKDLSNMLIIDNDLCNKEVEALRSRIKASDSVWLDMEVQAIEANKRLTEAVNNTNKQKTRKELWQSFTLIAVIVAVVSFAL